MSMTWRETSGGPNRQEGADARRDAVASPDAARHGVHRMQRCRRRVTPATKCSNYQAGGIQSWKRELANVPKEFLNNRPFSVYHLGEMPMQSCGQSVSAPREKTGARLNAYTELRAERQRSAREAIYRNRPICGRPYRSRDVAPDVRHDDGDRRLSEQRGLAAHVVAPRVEVESKIEAKLKPGHPCVSFKRLDPGAFNEGLIGSTCTARPCWGP